MRLGFRVFNISNFVDHSPNNNNALLEPSYILPWNYNLDDENNWLLQSFFIYGTLWEWEWGPL